MRLNEKAAPAPNAVPSLDDGNVIVDGVWRDAEWIVFEVGDDDLSTSGAFAAVPGGTIAVSSDYGKETLLAIDPLAT